MAHVYTSIYTHREQAGINTQMQVYTRNKEVHTQAIEALAGSKKQHACMHKCNTLYRNIVYTSVDREIFVVKFSSIDALYSDKNINIE